MDDLQQRSASAETNTVDQSATAIDLFAGCGGLTLGLKQAGFRVLAAVEIDPLAVETYRANHPEVTVCQRDITQLSTGELMNHLGLQKGELALLAGCPPCEGFSRLRTLNGARSISDGRNDLVFDFLLFVHALEPKAVMMENVPGLSSDLRIQVIKSELQRLGYGPICGVLNAQDYGVPQRRRRMILLGVKGMRVDFAPRDPARITVRHTIHDLAPPGGTGDPLHDLPENRTQDVMELIQRIPKDGGSRTDLSDEEQLPCHKRCNGFKDVYGRMAWDDVAPTITTGCFNPSKGRFLHPEQDRTITLREAALLQSFPGDYAISLRQGKSGAAGLVGNALPPEFVRRQALQVRDGLLKVDAPDTVGR